MGFILLAALVIAIVAGPTIWVRRTLQKYSQPENRYSVTGAALARELLQLEGMEGVDVEPAEGAIGDHYDPTTRTITTKGKPPPIPGTKKAKKAPIVPLIAGGGLLVASGVMYALAGSAKAKFKCNPAEGGTDCPTTSEELTALRSRANLFVLGSGIALVGGLGIGVTGILVEDETPTLTLSGRF